MIDYINITNKVFDNNVLNIDTERFFREAEDYFYYFDRQDLAIKNLKAAIKLSPTHIRCIKFLGDIYYAGGNMKKAFEYYSQAAALQPESTMILSSLAVVCDAMQNFQNALDFINLAFKYYTIKDIKIYAQMCDLKFSLLIKLRKYNEAKKYLDKIKKVLPFEDAKIVSISNNSDILNKKLALKERMNTLNIKVV